MRREIVGLAVTMLLRKLRPVPGEDVVTLVNECGNVRGGELVGEPLPSFSEPDKVSVADLDLQSLEYQSAAGRAMMRPS